MTLSLLYILLTGTEHILDTFDGGQQWHSGVLPFLNQSIQEQQGMVFYYLPSVSDNGETKETRKMKNKNLKKSYTKWPGVFSNNYILRTICCNAQVLPLQFITENKDPSAISLFNKEVKQK